MLPTHHTPSSSGSPAQPPARSASPLTPAQLAHELNNLLDGSLRSVCLVKNRLRDLAGMADDQAIIEKYLRTAQRSMRQMADVIERYGQQEVTRDLGAEPVLNRRGSLLDTLTHAVNVYGPVIEQRGIELATRLDAELGHLPGGPVYTVLANALNNAMQAIDRSGRPGPHRIAIRLLDQDDSVCLQVTDTGCGLEPGVLDDAGRFRFGITTRADGHGVGLGVCRQIAEDLGGQLTITPGPDGGAKLQMQFPKPSTPGDQTGQPLWPNSEARRAG